MVSTLKDKDKDKDNRSKNVSQNHADDYGYSQNDYPPF